MEQHLPVLPVAWEKMNDAWDNYVKGYLPTSNYFGNYDVVRWDTAWPDKEGESPMAQHTAAVQRTKYILDEADLPTQWYNIQADLKTPVPPVLHPGTGQPIGPQDLAPLFPMALIAQEVSQERWIDIPEEVRDVLRLWRPSPLDRKSTRLNS